MPVARLWSASYTRNGLSDEVEIGEKGFVIVTLGSMTEASSLGSMDSAPVLNGKADGGAWTLWEKLAAGRPEFGQPSVFADHIEESKWVSFTTTQRDPTFFHLVRDLTGNVPGEGGLITFADSSWLTSIVLPQQPHFIGQPEDVSVFWGYGLFVDNPGDFVKKPMSACTGREIMTEIMGHLHIESEASQILNTSICIPCMMPSLPASSCGGREASARRLCPVDRRTWFSLDSFVNCRTTWCLPSSTRSAPRRRPSTRCSGWIESHRLSTKASTTRAFSTRRSRPCTT